MRIKKWIGLGMLVLSVNASFAIEGVVIGGRNSGPNALVNTANIAITANNALLLNGQTVDQMTVGTANIALTANYVDWPNVGNTTQVVTNDYNGSVVINGGVSVNGTVSANTYIGSGSLLNNVSHFTTAAFDSNDVIKTVTDAFSTATSMIIIKITSATPPVGVWTVTPKDGTFDVNSYTIDGVAATEPTSIAFDYYIVR